MIEIEIDQVAGKTLRTEQRLELVGVKNETLVGREKPTAEIFAGTRISDLTNITLKLFLQRTSIRIRSLKTELLLQQSNVSILHVQCIAEIDESNFDLRDARGKNSSTIPALIGALRQTRSIDLQRGDRNFRRQMTSRLKRLGQLR